MLTENEKNNLPLSAVKKTRARIIKLKKTGASIKNTGSKKDDLLPPLNQFNTGYIKAKENDPL